ncbi:Hsp70 family protein [Stieleria varia]|uniref:Chaperone protein DnaK n=1 Tax=Stieleria varia TaxID=2528005 RepID=A0A5C6AM82_9BACT|nr:Hsp70 family protein [Stieleria varia]TWU01125.1 Chaperone protein DnaK [Stieleria varia]
MSTSTDPIVGIDLGTTNSVIAALIDGRPTVLAVDGQSTMPSVVGLNSDDQLITGTVARNQLAAFPQKTVASIKRRMGKMDPVTLGDQSFTPPEISAMILRRLRDEASRALGCSVNRAVITVPAYFDENQRQATREAAELAGLKVERIINEPTAATLVYHNDSTQRKHVVVYDFGGGTFDVSVVRMEDGVIEVLSSQGDTQLGGDDIDLAILEFVADEFQDEHDIDLRSDDTSRYRLLQACEKAKIALSTLETAMITEEFIAEKDGVPLNLNTSISRSIFDELCEPFVQRTVTCVDRALKDSGLGIHQIDDLVLVGGSTRIVLVQDYLRRDFRREPSRSVDPDLAVALGAAVQAAMIDGQSVGTVLVDVSSHTLGIRALGDMTLSGPEVIFSPIIHRNTPLPARYEQAFSTVHDEQKQVAIKVLQGEHRDPDRNQLIGEFSIELDKADGNYSKIVVRFDLTLDGTLKVTATQPASGIRQELSVDNALSQFVATDRERVSTRLEEMFESSDEMLTLGETPDGMSILRADGEHPSGQSPKQTAIEKARERFPAAYALLQKADHLKSSVTGEDAADLESLRSNLCDAIESEDEAAILSLSAELDDVLFYVQ